MFNKDSSCFMYRKAEQALGFAGNQTLLDVLKERLHISPLKEPVIFPFPAHDSMSLGTFLTTDTVESSSTLGPLIHAPKITAEDRKIRWADSTWRQLCLLHGALGGLWDDQIYKYCNPKGGSKRLKIHEIELFKIPRKIAGNNRTWLSKLEPGQPILFTHVAGTDYENSCMPADFLLETLQIPPSKESRALAGQREWFVCVKGSRLLDMFELKECTLESGPQGKGQVELIKLLMKKLGIPVPDSVVIAERRNMLPAPRSHVRRLQTSGSTCRD